MPKLKKTPVIWMMPVAKMDESLFNVYVVERGSWYVLMRKMNKILRTQPLVSPLLVSVLTRDDWLEEAPAKPAGRRRRCGGLNTPSF